MREREREGERRNEGVVACLGLYLNLLKLRHTNLAFEYNPFLYKIVLKDTPDEKFVHCVIEKISKK